MVLSLNNFCIISLLGLFFSPLVCFSGVRDTNHEEWVTGVLGKGSVICEDLDMAYSRSTKLLSVAGIRGLSSRDTR